MVPQDAGGGPLEAVSHDVDQRRERTLVSPLCLDHRLDVHRPTRVDGPVGRRYRV